MVLETMIGVSLVNSVLGWVADTLETAAAVDKPLYEVSASFTEEELNELKKSGGLDVLKVAMRRRGIVEKHGG